MQLTLLKYDNIKDFILYPSKKRIPETFSLIFSCKGLNTDYTFKSTCFGCLFCVLNDEQQLKTKYINHFKNYDLCNFKDRYFKGNLVSPIKSHTSLKNPYSNIEKFTSTKETTHIQPWSAGILNCTSSQSCRVGREINIPNTDYNRDGRLDIAAITDSYLLAIEAKISLKDALIDERFIEQFDKYNKEIKDIITEKGYKYNLLLLIGDKETDLLPPSHIECSSNIGDMSSRFYNILDTYGIKFISANALLGLSFNHLLSKDPIFAWDNFIPRIFEDENCVGIVSAGKIVKINNSYEVKPC